MYTCNTVKGSTVDLSWELDTGLKDFAHSSNNRWLYVRPKNRFSSFVYFIYLKRDNVLNIHTNVNAPGLAEKLVFIGSLFDRCW